MKPAVKTMFKHIRRSPFQALSASLVLTITFFLISVFSLVSAGSEKIIRYFETRPQVTAFIKHDATDEQIADLRKKVQALPGVGEVNYTSKEDALKLYREQNKDDPLLLEMVTADILPASVEVSASNPDILNQIADVMGQHDAVEEIVHQRSIIDTLLRWTRAIRVSGLGLAGFFLFSSLTTVVIIISMKITNRKAEIEIMRLLGATGGQIVLPFLLEGMGYGAVGSFVGWGLSYLALLYSTPLILRFFGAIPLLPIPILLMLALLGVLLFVGITVGFAASLFASRRFLRPA